MSNPVPPEKLLHDVRFDHPTLTGEWNRIFQGNLDRIEVIPLQGDASTRRYFRLLPKTGPAGNEAPASVILMHLEEPVTGRLDFISLREFLEGLKLPVPHLHHYDAARGLLWLQDCGDLLLESVLVQADTEQQRRWYSKAVDLLTDMQFRATEVIEPDSPAFHRRFDVEKLMWELDFMLEHYVEGMLATPLTGPVREKIWSEMQALCKALADEPVCFTHRDYHCRNLMVHQDELVLIDFQDARFGPCQYDLVSLLRDSYVTLPDALLWELVDRYIDRKTSHTGEAIDRKQFLRIFDWMSVQRNLKAVGTFAYQTRVKHNNRYRVHIEPTLNYVKQSLGRQPELSDLHTALAQVIPTLAQ